MKKSVKVGLCGLGTVGSGVCKLFEENHSLIQKRSGLDIRVTRAVTIDPVDGLGLDLSKMAVSDSKNDVLNDPDIDIVVELIGGTTVAKDIILEALDKGKSVVTANKALIAEHSSEIFTAAYKSAGFFAYEASVGGGIPIIRNVRDGFSGDRIDKISGIMNGTCNYILSLMTHENVDFLQALEDAVRIGYAEADPSLDIDGTDTAHKVLILMELAFNGLFDFNQLHIEGVRNIRQADIKSARDLGYRIKLLGKAERCSKGFEGRIHPALVKSDGLLASVEKQFNAISLYGNFSGHTLAYGSGAGSRPTASAVVSDIIEASRLLTASHPVPSYPLGVDEKYLAQKEIIPIEEIETKYYLGFTISEAELAMEKIAAELDKSNINIAAFGWPEEIEEDDSIFHVAIITGKVIEKEMQSRLKAIDAMSFIASPTRLIRVD